MVRPGLHVVSPTAENRTVETPRRLANAEYRSREYLTPTEVDRLIKAAGKNRYGHRDASMLLVCYRYGLRASELVGLDWSQVDFNAGHMHVRRLKGSTDAVHPIRGYELRALRRLRRDQEPKSSFVFTSERGSPFSTAGFLRMVQTVGEAAKLGFPVHPHMLRHATGYKVANDGVDTRTLQAYLGHRSINQYREIHRACPDEVQGPLEVMIRWSGRVNAQANPSRTMMVLDPLPGWPSSRSS